MVVTKRGKQRRAWFPGVAAFLPLLATQTGDEDCGSVCVYVVVAGECETMNQSRIFVFSTGTGHIYIILCCVVLALIDRQRHTVGVALHCKFVCNNSKAHHIYPRPIG